MDNEGEQPPAAADHLDGEVDAACNGDSSALGRLVEIVRPRLKKCVEYHLKWPLSQKLDASDLAQEALLAALRSFNGFRGRTWNEFAAWATQIARREALKAQRHWTLAMRDIRRERPAEDSDLAADERPTELHVSQWRETAALLLQLIDELPHEFQQVLRLRYYDGLTVQEISQRLHRHREAVAGSLRRGLEWLRELAERKGLHDA